MYSDKTVIQLLQEICVDEANGEAKVFDRKFLNSRFCACAMKYAQNSLMVLSNRQNFIPFMGNRSRWTRRYL